ncbi:MAG TPA: response regulator [Myxococcaceae bacterium]|jgi:CheY-like chemotaxis protein
MSQSSKRILIIDDSEAIHQDFHRILCPSQQLDTQELDQLEDELFGDPPASSASGQALFELDSAFQGKEGLARLERALSEGRPYSLVFLDYRMPPGWNGVETLRHLLKVAPSLQVVLCSAYADYSWEEIAQEFGRSEQLLELRKPFNSQELRQLALRLTGGA